MSIDLTWYRQQASDIDGDDELGATSVWPMNTFLGAQEVLYGEARSGGVMVGRVLLGIESNAVEIDKVWVATDWRRQGVATQMLREGMLLVGMANAYAPNLTEDGEAWWQYVAPAVENNETGLSP